MKRLTALLLGILIIITCLSLSGCKQEGNDSTTTTQAPATDDSAEREEAEKVAVAVAEHAFFYRTYDLCQYEAIDADAVLEAFGYNKDDKRFTDEFPFDTYEEMFEVIQGYREYDDRVINSIQVIDSEITDDIKSFVDEAVIVQSSGMDHVNGQAEYVTDQDIKSAYEKLYVFENTQKAAKVTVRFNFTMEGSTGDVDMTVYLLKTDGQWRTIAPTAFGIVTSGMMGPSYRYLTVVK